MADVYYTLIKNNMRDFATVPEKLKPTVKALIDWDSQPVEGQENVS